MEKCSFCGKKITEVGRLVKSPLSDKNGHDIFICDVCSGTVQDIIHEALPDINKAQKSETENEGDTDSRSILYPKDIRHELDRYIIGQDKAKEALSVGIFQHYLRMKDQTGIIGKSNIFLAGPSGSGKTLLAKTIAKILDVPFSMVSATSLTESGYVGDDPEICIQRLVKNSNYKIEKALYGVVFIDEIDKIAMKSRNTSISRDVSGEGVQAALLKIIEGSSLSVIANINRRSSGSSNMMFDTSNVLFIVGGCFPSIFDKYAPKHNTIGFSTSPQTNDCTSIELTHDLFIQAGMMREFMGRFPVLVRLDELTEAELIRVLVEPDNAITKEYIEMFRQLNIELIPQDDFITGVAHQAFTQKVGARGLRSIMEKYISPILYQYAGQDAIGRCILTKDTLITGEPIIELKKMRNTRKKIKNNL